MASGGFLHPLGCTPGGRCQHHLFPCFLKVPDHQVGGGGLPGTRSPGQYHQPALCRLFHGFHLYLVQISAQFPEYLPLHLPVLPGCQGIEPSCQLPFCLQVTLPVDPGTLFRHQVPTVQKGP